MQAYISGTNHTHVYIIFLHLPQAFVGCSTESQMLNYIETKNYRKTVLYS